ncbi:MAG: hypothetical protein IJW20_05215 [Clostridia bacterium]|nr:hypothetical protein [Clostridia bacterium]
MSNGTMVKVYDSKPKLDYNVENKKRAEATEKALTTLLEKYKTEEVSEEERITDYYYTGYGLSEMEDETIELKCTISFVVTPYLEENSIWEKGSQRCYASFDRIDGELILKNISLTPENHEKFLEAFEEYEKKQESIIETTGVPAEASYVTSENKIEELSNIIFIVSAIILVIAIVKIIVFKLKNKKQ